MSFINYKQRFYASLIFLGAGFLFFRTLSLLSEGVLGIYVLWVSILLFAEMAVDAACMITSIPWWIANNKKKDSIPLTLAAALTLLHAVRVIIFVLGRTGPWLNFDIRPEQRAMHYTRWAWGEVYFAGILSFLSVIVVFVIWSLRRRAKKRDQSNKTDIG